MKKTTTLMLFLVLGLEIFAQNHQFQLNPIDAPNVPIVPGTILERGIMNTGSDPVEFFQLGNDPGFEYRYLNDSTRLASSIPVFTGDSIGFIKKLLDNETRIYKSPRFKNTHLVFDPWDGDSVEELLSLQLSPIAGDRLPFQQCYQYAMKSGYNTARLIGFSGFSTISFNAHTVLNAPVLGDATLRDNDPGTAGCTQPDVSTQSGLLSVANAANDPNRITEQYFYTMENGFDSILAPQSISNYRQYYSNSYNEYHLSPSIPVYKAQGSNILCGGCGMKVYDYGYNKLFINTNDSATSALTSDPKFLGWYQSFQNGNLSARDSIIAGLGTLFPNIPYDSLYGYFVNGKIQAVGPNGWVPNFYDANYYNDFRYYEITVPQSHADTLFLGKDLLFSYFVNKIETFGGSLLLKDSIISGTTEYDLYSPMAPQGGCYPKTVVTLLDKGFIPPNVGAKFRLYYNHLMDQHEIVTTGFEEFGGTNHLSIYEKIVYPNWYIDTAVVQSIAHNDFFKFSLYPNPTTGIVTIETPQKGLMVIRNLQGQEILNENILEGVTSITLPQQTGIYLVSLGGGTKKLVVQ